MRKFLIFLLMSWPALIYADIVETLVSGSTQLCVDEINKNEYVVKFTAYGVTFNPDNITNPVLVIDAKYKRFFCHYTSYLRDGDNIVMISHVTLTPSTIVMEVRDTYVPKSDGAFELSRSVRVKSLGTSPYTKGFWTSFGVQFSSSDSLLDYDYFIPGVWYRTNFLAAGNLPSYLPQKNDKSFLYRDDRTPLPVLAMRNKNTGVTVTIVDLESMCETMLSDAAGVKTNVGYQFGGVGVVQYDKTSCFSAVATYPGNDSHASGVGERRHPFAMDADKHYYKIYIRFSQTPNYASAVSGAWIKAFELYNPKIYAVNLSNAYKVITKTCNYYYLSPNSVNNVNVHKPGFPWNVFLYGNFSTNSSTYEIGFVGAQTEVGYALLRAGIDSDNASYIAHGISVLDFWANEGLSVLGLPKTRYYAENGTWDTGAYTSLRQACTGMTAILEAWCYYKKNGKDKTNWLAACRKFGDWLVNQQNTDGSWYMEYNPFTIYGNTHSVGKRTKYLTVCALRYLIELYIVTGDDNYKEALYSAAEYSYKYNHSMYFYLASVIDNPQTIDSESGQQAMQNFLSMYDFTKDRKWLDAAEQAAIYTATWTFMHEVPVESDQTAITDWPKDRSIVGQHLIAIGHSAADFGFAWSSFVYYRLYVITGKDIYLKLARIAAHNTKQSMNLGQTLYPGREEGLQQEAFHIGTLQNGPRRQNSVMQALTWNFAAHLDPMIRFKDAYGRVDLEEVELMPKEEIVRLDDLYSSTQSADYGQGKTNGIEIKALDDEEPCGMTITDSQGSMLFNSVEGSDNSKADNVMRPGNVYIITYYYKSGAQRTIKCMK